MYRTKKVSSRIACSALTLALCAGFLSACGEKAAAPTPAAAPAASAPVAAADATVQFQKNEAVGIARPEFDATLKSIVEQGKPGQKLEITGISYANEQGKPGEDLGKARAEAAGIFFMDKVPPEQQVYAAEKSLLSAPEGQFGGVRFKWIDAPAAVAAAPAPPAAAPAPVAQAPVPAPPPIPAPAPTPAPAPVPAPVAPAAAPTVSGPVTLYFSSGSATPKLNAGARAQLKALATTSTAITVEGHTDASGNAERNLALSQARANAVKKILVRLGAKADSVTVSGAGSTKPVDEKVAAKNRRAEVR